jgi:hypothetical protein
MEVKFPLTAPEKSSIPEDFNITEYLENFSKSFDCRKIQLKKWLKVYLVIPVLINLNLKPQSKEVEIPFCVTDCINT